MSTVNSYDRMKQFAEMNVPYDAGSGMVTPAVQKARALANLGINSSAAELAVLDGAVAGTAVPSKAMVTNSANGIGAFRDTRTTPIFNQPAPATATATETLTAAKLLTGLINGTPAAAVNYTLPLATDLETALLALYPGLAVDDAFEFSIQNLSVTDGQDITVLTNTGWTLSGRMIIEANNVTTIGFATACTFRVRRTAANAYTLYRVAG